MIPHPAYYETVRQKAAQRWNQLEQDPELADPWHQLFKQVQSPLHILLEDTDESEPTAGAGEDQESDGFNIEDIVNLEEDETEDISVVYVDTEQENENKIETTTRPGPPPTRSKPDIMERNCKSQGFRKDSDNRIFYENGNWIAQAIGARFPRWHRTATGNLVRYYWPKDHYLEREPLQLKTDVWNLLEQHPEYYSLVLADIEGVPVEVTCSRLRSMCD